MCGIAGVFHTQGQAIERERLERMGGLLAHRGPDAQGIYQEGGLGLVHRRLSIIDLDARSEQPMRVEHCLLIYNGEIYNYLEIRAVLEGLGHQFRTESDSEVLVRAYLQWGRDCLRHFNGMWAFALWDEQKQVLWCARDRFGVKPFYYAEVGAEFRFASEPKALLGDDAGLRRLNPRALGRFLVESICDDEEETFFAGVKPLAPAHHLWIARNSGLSTQRYWALAPGHNFEAALELASVRLQGAPAVPALTFAEPKLPPHSDVSFYTAAEALRALLQDSVRLRLRSDVPVGTCLSGGMDSSSIVSIASALSSQPIRTFSSEYTEADCSESDYIRTVVEGCKTRATRVIPQPEELVSAMAKICWAQDEPSGSATLFTQWKVMQSAHNQVKVLLDGQGGDEVFAGYLPYLEDYVWDLAFQHQERSELAACEELAGRSFAKVASKARWQSRLPAFLRKPEKLRPDPWKPPAYLQESLRRQMAAVERSRTPARAWPDRLSRRLAQDLTHLSIPQLLRYEDRNSMAFSIEARTPFLDYRLVEFAFALPSQYKIHQGWTKRVLRTAVAGLAPPEIILRRDKKGYPTPAVHWYRGPLKQWVGDLLHSAAAREWFQAERLDRLFAEHQQGADHSWEIWRVLSVLEWQRLFLKGEGFADPPRSSGSIGEPAAVPPTA
ncbi:MAG: asparagine synthase (glutamine-hydrolyzing) [Candidatus Eremiobacteraeota bacterium]|nr:asparagine synthase (glutamine-hydrolyzing) [Candidatus Eremiobacteraeota bacterium]MCW5868662.1 asparagine synthase (glutamine-hydrolyzing) [Candidatus Eremiobacteraeota bacterium]